MASARLKAITPTLSSKSKLYSCGSIYILRLHDFDSWQSQSQLAEIFLGNVMQLQNIMQILPI